MEIDTHFSNLKRLLEAKTKKEDKRNNGKKTRSTAETTTSNNQESEEAISEETDVRWSRKLRSGNVQNKSQHNRQQETKHNGGVGNCAIEGDNQRLNGANQKGGWYKEGH